MNKIIKVPKIFLAITLMIGAPCPIISAELLEMGHKVWFVPICYVSAFIGTALIFGASSFRDRPMYIGNVDGNYTKPKINQTWAVFFISLIANLTMANLCG
jgi:hypothetical protein